MSSFFYIVAITLISALLAALAQYIFKSSIKKFSINLSEIMKTVFSRSIMTGISLYLISLCIYLFALHYGELSFVYPFIASTFIFVALISRYKLGEKFGTARIIGILLIVLGIVMTALTY